MLQIDPTSPRTCGVDANGEPVRLGEISTTGCFVGYIDEGGVDWESREEHDVSKGSCALYDAFIVWNRTGGQLGPRPNGSAILDEAGILPEYRTKAFVAFGEMVSLARVCSAETRAIQAMMN